MKERCATCGHWNPDRPVGSLVREGGKCALLEKETRTDYSCWWWREAAPAELEAREKAGLIEE